MMQILGLRGKASPESPNPNSTHSPSSAPPSMGPARPLRLVYCDDKGRFQMDPEAVSALQLVKGPVGVVSVCGRARQGKSFILNQLLGRSSGFQVASTHRPCTKGLWMWSTPIKRTALDGSEYSFLLLDSEGIDAYDQTGTYSTQIFSLAVLLSSMFIYNQMGGIDEAALDRLSLVTEMTKHIRVRASGGRSTAAELGQFSPVFVWLLRDFYLDLTEDNRKITPRDYLELALRPMHGGGKALSAKNEIRESIRALFPDRECFTLVRPLNDESDLQRLDQINLNRLRPEFRAGLDALTKFVFERTKPKQVGSTVMTGPVLALITQSFLDALNSGAVPTISSSWQSVEEKECLRAFEVATEVYMSSFDRKRPPDEVLLLEAHETAVSKSMDAFNMIAVGAGSTRQKYEKKLHSFFKKAFEDYRRSIFLEADARCTTTLQNMENKLRTACHAPGAKLDHVIKVLDDFFSEYVNSTHGPGKWQKLATFFQQCLDGLILDLFKRNLCQLESDKTAITLQLRSNEDKLGLLKKQVEASEKHRNEYMKRYEEAVNDKRRISDDYSSRIANLQTKSRTLEEKCATLSKTLDSAKQDCSSWKLKYEHSVSDQKADEDRFKAGIAILKSRASAAEGRLAAAREQAQSAHEEASEWKRKYDTAVGEAKAALERAAIAQERTSKKAQEREDALRTEFSANLAENEDEIRLLEARIDQAENKASSFISQVQVAESKLRDRELETLALKERTRVMDEKLEFVSATAQSFEKEAQQLKQEKRHLEEKYRSEFKKFEEADLRCRSAENDARRATEMADGAREEAAAALKEKSEIQRLAMERLTQIERAQRQVENLERERIKMMEEIRRLRESEMDAVAKVTHLEERVEEREREMEQMLNRSNEQRSETVQVLESLLATERATRVEANERAESLSVQLQATQRKLDAAHQELASVRLSETALDSRLKATSHGKSRVDDFAGTESVQDMEVNEGTGKRQKKSRSTTSPLKYGVTETSQCTEDYTKLTVLKLKSELTKNGFGAKLLQLKNPNRMEILGLYEKLVLKK